MFFLVLFILYTLVKSKSSLFDQFPFVNILQPERVFKQFINAHFIFTVKCFTRNQTHWEWTQSTVNPV